MSSRIFMLIFCLFSVSICGSESGGIKTDLQSEFQKILRRKNSRNALQGEVQFHPQLACAQFNLLYVLHPLMVNIDLKSSRFHEGPLANLKLDPTILKGFQGVNLEGETSSSELEKEAELMQRIRASKVLSKTEASELRLRIHSEIRKATNKERTQLGLTLVLEENTLPTSPFQRRCFSPNLRDITPAILKRIYNNYGVDIKITHYIEMTLFN